MAMLDVSHRTSASSSGEAGEARSISTCRFMRAVPRGARYRTDELSRRPGSWAGYRRRSCSGTICGLPNPESLGCCPAMFVASSISCPRSVTATKFHGCQFRDDGARRPASRMRSRFSRAIGWSVHWRRCGAPGWRPTSPYHSPIARPPGPHVAPRPPTTAAWPTPHPDCAGSGTTKRRFGSLADGAERVPPVTARRAQHRPAVRSGVESGRGW